MVKGKKQVCTVKIDGVACKKDKEADKDTIAKRVMVELGIRFAKNSVSVGKLYEERDKILEEFEYTLEVVQKTRKAKDAKAKEAAKAKPKQKGSPKNKPKGKAKANKAAAATASAAMKAAPEANKKDAAAPDGTPVKQNTHTSKASSKGRINTKSSNGGEAC